MSVLALQCPHCSTRLRVRDQSFIGRTIHCPDCAGALKIVRSGAGDVQGVLPEPAPHTTPRPESTAAASGRPASQAAPDASWTPLPQASFWTPMRMAWGIAVTAALSAWIWVLMTPSQNRPRGAGPPADEGLAAADRQAAAPAVDQSAPPVPAAGGEAPPAAGEQSAPGEGESGPLPEAGQRLRTVAAWVGEYRQQQGQFPAEPHRAATLNERDRLGWIAEVVADREPAGAQPLWDRPLDDPLNGRFVRRRMPQLLLPDIRELAADGLPATHIVGVAGVGSDGARLPVGHPRAGIFGIGRTTRVEDVRDGLSQTLLLVGLQQGFAPWAAGGDRTIRSFTAEPYIHGPDQFGTGQPNGMFVALADGSVRFLSVDTSPLVIRRMAAMADGLPLDPRVPGEPGATPEPPQVATANPPVHQPDPVAAPPMAQSEAAAEAPIEPRLARDPPPAPPKPSYNIERALQQPIRRFSQVRPVRLIELLRQVEELAGIPVDVTDVERGPAADRLQREVRLELSDTTVAGILTALVEQVDLRFETGSEFGIRLQGPE